MTGIVALTTASASVAGAHGAADQAGPALPTLAAEAGARLVCSGCGQVHAWVALAPGRLARCVRCDAVMARGHRLDASAQLALTLAALVVFAIALSTDLITIRLRGAEVDTTLFEAIAATWRDGAPLVAVLTALTAVLAPAAYIGVRLALLLPLVAGRVPAALGPCLRVLHFVGRWNMVSVLGVGALLSLVRIAALAQASAGPGLLAFGVLAWLLAALEAAGLRHLWPPAAAPAAGERPAPAAGSPAPSQPMATSAAAPAPAPARDEAAEPVTAPARDEAAEPVTGTVSNEAAERADATGVSDAPDAAATADAAHAAHAAQAAAHADADADADADAAANAAWAGCECCGWTGPWPAPGHPARDPGEAPAARALAKASPLPRCPRCRHPLAHDPHAGLQRTWALLLASAVLLVPANLMPMMSTVQALRTTPHTLIGGIAELWADDAWGLAILVFVASIVVPLLKIGALALLAWTTRRAPAWRRLERTRLYRLVEAVGQWSMLDVYVVLLLVGMVRFGNLAGAMPGPGLLAFAAVVVLTMLAAHSFDPRWIWRTRSPA